MARKKEKYKTRPDGRKMTAVRTGRYKDDGRPESIIIYGRTDDEIDMKRAEIKMMSARGNVVGVDRVQVSVYIDRWLALYKSHLRPNTFRSYTFTANHIKAYMGNTQLRSITSDMCQDMVNELWDKPKTCINVASVMKQIERKAMSDGIVARPFWVGIQMPKMKPNHRRQLTAEEKEALKKADLSPQDRAFVSVLYGCGLRKEEALGLMVDDIDRKNRTVTVRRVLTYAHGNKPDIENDAKTASSFRTVPVPDSVWLPIISYVDTCDGFLFKTEKGTPATTSSYKKMWGRIKSAMNEYLDEPTEITAHYFRHNYATMLAYSGISEAKAVQLMGHSDGTMIRKVYAHIQEDQEKTVERLNRSIVI